MTVIMLARKADWPSKSLEITERVKIQGSESDLGRVNYDLWLCLLCVFLAEGGRNVHKMKRNVIWANTRPLYTNLKVNMAPCLYDSGQ